MGVFKGLKMKKLKDEAKNEVAMMMVYCVVFTTFLVLIMN